jgi:hypothetical protein
MTTPRLNSRTVMLIVLLLLVNTPVIHAAWTAWRVSSSGTDVQATVQRTPILGTKEDPAYYVTFTYPDDIDPRQSAWPAQLEKSAWDKAKASGEVRVRVLKDQPAAYRIPGQVRSYVGWAITVFADLALLGMIWLSRRYSGHRRPLPMRIAAIEPVARGPVEPLIEQVEGDLYLVRGEVLYVADDEIILDAGDREVIVILDGHPNPVGHEQPAQVRGRLVG